MSARSASSNLFVLISAMLLGGCGQPGEPTASGAGAGSNNSTEPTELAEPTRDLADQARQLAQSAIIIDTHIDVPYRLTEEWADVSEATASGDFDYPRAREGGLDVAFMSIYTPAELESQGKSKELAEQLIDLVNRLVAESPDKFAHAFSPADVEKNVAAGLISLPMGMENGSPIEGDLANLQHFYDRGIRYITLAHSLSNHIADSSYDDNKQWGGLSDFGFEVVKEMNRVGIMVDVSHISDDAFWDVMEVTAAPVIASHSSARHFTPGFERNMNDKMIKRLAENNGVIMINFGSSFLTQEANEYSSAKGDAYEAYLAANGLADSEEVSEDVTERFDAEYEKAHGPFPYATLAQVLDQFDYVVQLAGIDHVGIGSDFDGVGDSLPIGLKDVSGYPNLVEGLLKRGYSEQDIRKILGENLLRVWRKVAAVAEQM